MLRGARIQKRSFLTHHNSAMVSINLRISPKASELKGRGFMVCPKNPLESEPCDYVIPTGGYLPQPQLRPPAGLLFLPTIGI